MKANNSAHAGVGYANSGYQQRNSYGNSDPYANKNDPYKKSGGSDKEKQEKKGPWAMDFEILRFFRENYNAGIDFEESPRAFFDEEYMLGMRIRLLKRNFTTILIKIIVMVLFSVGALFLSTKPILLLGFLYTFVFMAMVAVPMAFVKYARKYIVIDTEEGKLRKPHATYASYIKPLETVAIKALSLMFIFIQIVMFFFVEKIHKYFSNLEYINKFEKSREYVSTISVSDMQSSIIIVGLFYIASYVLYEFFMRKLWTPKWEAARKANELMYRRTNQRTARNLRDELSRESE